MRAAPATDISTGDADSSALPVSSAGQRCHALVVSAGGAEAKGGVGRIIKYFSNSWAMNPAAPRLDFIDTTKDKPGFSNVGVFLGAVLQSLRLVLTKRVSLVHVHVAANGSVLRKGCFIYGAAMFRTPTILHMHGADFAEFWQRLPKVVRHFARHCFRCADRVIVLGTYWREFALREMALDMGRVVMLPNAVPVPSQLPAKENDEPVILFLGRIVPEKGPADLIQALASPEIASLSWRCVFAGVGDVSDLRQLTDELRLTDRFEFLGWQPVEAAYGLLSKADIFALPSYNEGLPMAILEAMAHGAAVVTTPVGSNTDAITDRVTGLIHPPGNIPALVRALHELIGRPELRARLQRQAYEKCLQEFSIEKYASRLLMLYESIAHRPEKRVGRRRTNF